MSRLFQTIFSGLLALLLYLPNVSSAVGPEVWTNLGLYGGDVQTLTVDPSNPDRLFAGIWFGEGLFRSIDGAVSWQALKMEEYNEGEDTFNNQVLLALSLSPSNPDVVWATHNYWVARSEDGGDSWSHILNSTIQRDCLNCGGSTDNFRFCFALASDPNDPDIAYVGTAGAWSTYSGGAVYKTVDGGASWEKLNQGDNLDYTVVSLAVDPNTPQVIWSATDSFGFGGVWDGTVYRSIDSGQSWTPIEPKPFNGGGLNGVAPHPTDSNVVFVTGGGGIARGVFDGAGWSFTHPIDGSAQAYGLVFAPSDAKIVYVGWNKPEAWGGDGLPKVSRSVDGGLTWETYTLDADLASSPKTLAVHPTDPDTIFLGDQGGGILKSQDHGQTWVPVNTGLNGIVVNDVAVDANDTTHIIAATSGGVYERTGSKWERQLSNNAESVSFVPGSSIAFYAGLWGDLARTRDGGTSWTFSSKIANGWIGDIAIDPVDSQILFIADRSHVRRSTNGGDTFEPVLEGRNLVGESYYMNTLAFDPVNRDHIYAGGGNFTSPHVLGDLWASLDGGDTWQRTGLTDVIVNKVAVDPTNRDIIYAGCGYSGNNDTPLFKSTDAGATWKPAENGLPAQQILLKGVWAESENNVYASGGNLNILRFDGSDVKVVHSGGNQQTVHLEEIFGVDGNHIYVVGGDGTILRFDGSTWSPMQSGTTNYLYNIWGTASDDLFAVGVGGTILHFDGNAWTTMDSTTTMILRSVAGTSRDNVYAVGDEGTILHYDGDVWSQMPSPTSNGLDAVWAVAADAVFAGGADGTVIFFDGITWSPMVSGTQYTISDIWGIAPNDVYATINFNGQILHYDGTAWTSSTIPDATNLLSISGLSNGMLFVVDSHGGIYRYNGVQWKALRPAGSRFRSVTDLAFHRQNPDILYASTYQAGVFISPDQAGQWLNLGTPVLAVNAISAGSLYVATNGGLYQLTGTGVIAGKVVQAGSQKGIHSARIFTDSGVRTISVNGEYMMICPSGIHTVAVIADGQANQTLENIVVLGADVSWVDVAMQSGVSDQSLNFDANNNSSSGGGSYCFIGSAAF